MTRLPVSGNAVSYDVVPGPDGAARFQVAGKQYSAPRNSPRWSCAA